MKTKTQQEKKSLKVEVLEKLSTLVTAGFGLVAALAWNDTIKAVFQRIFPAPGGNLSAMIVYAVLITVLVVLITIQLGRTTDKAKKVLGKNN